MKENEKIQTGDGNIAVTSNRFLRWLDNFWYHYKWPTIGITFAFVVVLVCTLQTCSKEKQDITLLYAGPTSWTQESLAGVDRLLDEVVLPNDFDGDGEKNATLSHYLIYSEEQIKALDSAEYSINRQFNSEQYDTYGTYLMTGEASVCLLDPWLYEALKSADRLRNISDFYEEMPSGSTADGFGVRLGDTALYQKYEVLQVLPEDTVICLLRQQVVGKSHDDELYANAEEMFCALIGS